MPDVVSYPRNTKGTDFVIGDVHGNWEALQMVIKMLGPDDRLFIVGDLTDRGKGNLEVINGIIKYNEDAEKAGLSTRIIVARGNHEEMCLKSIEEMEKIALSDPEMGPTAFNLRVNNNDQLQLHFDEANGGQWLCDLFRKEFCENLSEDPAKTMGFSLEKGVVYPPDNPIAKIKKFFSELSYIVRIEGDEKHLPYNIVHADNPITDELIRKILDGKMDPNLPYDKKYLAIWSRNDEFERQLTGRNKNSSLSINGHNIVFKDGILSVRHNTNAIVIDVGAYYSNVFIMIDMKERKAIIVGKVIEEEKDKLSNILDTINLHLRAQMSFEILFGMISRLKTLKGIGDTVKSMSKDNEEKYKSYWELLFNNDGLRRFKIESLGQLWNELDKLGLGIPKDAPSATPPLPPPRSSAPPPPPPRKPLPPLPSVTTVSVFGRKPEEKERKSKKVEETRKIPPISSA